MQELLTCYALLIMELSQNAHFPEYIIVFLYFLKELFSTDLILKLKILLFIRYLIFLLNFIIQFYAQYFMVLLSHIRQQL